MTDYLLQFAALLDLQAQREIMTTDLPWLSFHHSLIRSLLETTRVHRMFSINDLFVLLPRYFHFACITDDDIVTAIHYIKNSVH